MGIFRKVYYKIIKKTHEKKYTVGESTIVMDDRLITKEVYIGSYVYIGYSCAIGPCTIGNYCSIANFVSIGQGEHDITKISTSGRFVENAWTDLLGGECVIGHDVWIGTGAIIRRGVRIGNGAVIGANSFVNSDVPDYGIAVGSPARVIKKRFDEQCTNMISESKWWNETPENAKIIHNKIINDLQNLK